jgi:hypothetical protein
VISETPEQRAERIERQEQADMREIRTGRTPRSVTPSHLPMSEYQASTFRRTVYAPPTVTKADALTMAAFAVGAVVAFVWVLATR